MKIIKTKKYKQAQIQQGRQFDYENIRNLIGQGVDVYQAIMKIFPNIHPKQAEQMKNYFQSTNIMRV